MFLKSLKISKGEHVIREIFFRKGINLIVDETPTANGQNTGNNVGKTTVLKLIDFCLGAKPAIIYSDAESKKETYNVVKDFLIDNKVLVTLTLKDDLENVASPELVIERNFAVRKGIVRRINGTEFTEKEFESQLHSVMFPEHLSEKPTFRQIISHNIRYRDESINNTLKTLDRYTSDVEYETLYLFLLGCVFEKGDVKQELTLKLKQEETYKARLEKSQTKTAYEAALSLIEDEIQELNKRKSNFNLNENFEFDLENLNQIKGEINKESSIISNLRLRRDLIMETKEELNSSTADIELQQLKMIYQQATDKIGKLQKTFEELVRYHNKMISEKINFILKDLPSLEENIQREKFKLGTLLEKERALSDKIIKSDSYEEFELLITELNERFRKKGEYENIVSQLNEVEENISSYSNQLNEIASELFSDEFEQIVKNQLHKFNKFFASISNSLYGERYALKYDKTISKNNQQMYKFSAFNANLSSGKKQGEILCFDIAYILFADDEKIPCLHFLLNDKKELMHDNQLVNVGNFILNKNIQFVASILKDRLPEELRDESYYIVRLSQNDKLFRIENNG